MKICKITSLKDKKDKSKKTSVNFRKKTFSNILDKLQKKSQNY